MKDATIEIISNIEKHSNADTLEICSVLGFKSVTRIGDFKVGDRIIFVRPDSVFPKVEWAEPYRRTSSKRVKANQLRGVWSEGICLPIHVLPTALQERVNVLNVGDDVGEIIDVYHFVSENLQEPGAIGDLPVDIPKTDEENYANMMHHMPFGELVDLSMKVDGKSCSFYYKIDTKHFGVVGRRLEFDLSHDNVYSRLVNQYDIQNKLTKFCEENQISLLIRGEAYGEGIQNTKNNPHTKRNRSWAMFGVYLIKDRIHAEKGHPLYYPFLAKKLDLPTVEMVEEDVIFTEELIQKYTEGINMIGGKPFEGIVVKHSRGSFKIMNKAYDSKK